jgi:phosphomevalonate kinase
MSELLSPPAGLRVSAPGKMMIAGEYAVLEGAEAVVAAVDRRAFVTLAPAGSAESGTGSLPREMLATRRVVEARFGALPGVLGHDARALAAQSGMKLGLGSSAALAAATAGVLMRAHGCNLDDRQTRALALDLALEGHRANAPQGSGADVAAAMLGGFVRFRRLGDGVETHALAWPAELHTVVVWPRPDPDALPTRTEHFVGKVKELAASEPTTHRACMSALAAESERFVSALMAAEIGEIIECFHDFGDAMGKLGTAAGVGIIDERLERLRTHARECGGAAKPSGAGGGDVALALFSSEQGANEFRGRCAEVGFEVLSIGLGVTGERYEEQS